MSIGVEVVKGNRIKAILEETDEAIDENMVVALNEVADLIVKDAKDFCPVDTGSLRKSIRRENIASPADNIKRIGVRAGGYVTNPKTGNIVDYASHIEFGTRNMAPRSFLRPAIRMNAERYRQILRDIVKKSLEDART